MNKPSLEACEDFATHSSWELDRLPESDFRHLAMLAIADLSHNLKVAIAKIEKLELAQEKRLNDVLSGGAEP